MSTRIRDGKTALARRGGVWHIPFGGSMGCCQCDGIESLFSPRWVNKELRLYREHGPGDTTQSLIDAVLERGSVRNMTLLDIGGGVGALHHELIKKGLREATDVDASTTYLGAARAEAARQGHAQKVKYLHGNFVDLAATIPPADIVLLDRVVCCYDDMTSLVDLSAARALRYYGLAYPRETFWVRLGVAAENFWQWIRRRSYRAFVHATEDIEEILDRHGLAEVWHGRSAFWQVTLYAR